MTTRAGRPFYPIENSTAPSFNSTSLSASTSYVLESTLRIWQGPSNRSVRLVNANSSASFFAKFGSSTVAAASSDSILIVGAWPSVFNVSPSQTWVSLVSSTDVTVNVTLGYAG